ncbi:MAG: PEPxxWA-CTERM sorting domain-containing protein [Pseudomonadota bacterium]
MAIRAKAVLGAAAMAGAMAFAGTAQAAYFVNAVASLGAEQDGGIQSNGPTSASASVAGGSSQASVDLSTGKAKAYVGFYGPDSPGGDFGSAGAVFGDTVTFTGATTATFNFAIEGIIDSDAIQAGNTSTLQLFGVGAIRVFQAGSGATANNFFNHAGALVSKTWTYELRNPAEATYEEIYHLLSGTLDVSPGASYDIFTSFSVGIAMNGQPVFASMDFLNTATYGIETADGSAFGSASGALVGSTPIPGGVPEPGTWALMIGGFGLAGAGLRRRRGALLA